MDGFIQIQRDVAGFVSEHQLMLAFILMALIVAFFVRNLDGSTSIFGDSDSDSGDSGGDGGD